MQTIKLKENQRLFTNKGAAPMGYGLPAAIGAYFADKKPIICIEGDGSLHMNIHELQTVYYNKIPIKIFIINNGGYLSIKQTQDNLCNGIRSLSCEKSGLSLPNYSKLANAYNIKYNFIKSNDDIDIVLSNVFDKNNLYIPEIIEIFVNKNEVFKPKVMAKFINNKIIPGKLEDIEW
jgi:acetolactate synthase I/II/III large subunit